MPVVKSRFAIDSKDIDKVQKSILNFQENSENAINEYLEKIGSNKVIKSVTDVLPYYKKAKLHAKESKWYDIEFYNMSFVLSNSLEGKRGTSFYYLYYPATGTGNSYKKGPNDFFETGFNNIYDSVVDGLIKSLENKIEEELNNE